MARPPRALTIAGSDSGGGAGIEADLKTFTALKVYGAAALTSVTAQNTVGVDAVHDLPAEMVTKQIDSVLGDVGADAVKSGMLSTRENVEAVADALERHGVANYVLDPVMVSETGHRLLNPDAEQDVSRLLLPLALVVTPNMYEASVLAKFPVENEDDMQRAAETIHGFGCRYVLVKGGHLEGDEAVDLLFDGSECRRYTAARVPTKNTHGTGCTYSAAIAAYLAKGQSVQDAVSRAKEYLTQALRTSFSLGSGAGPLNHFWPVPDV